MGFSVLIWVYRVEFLCYFYYDLKIFFSQLHIFFLSKYGRRQFDLANREAMDESAEWRLKYDVEAERATQCMNELKQVHT